MTITKNWNNQDCTFEIEGRIDTLTSAELEQAVAEVADKCEKLIFDMAGVDYVSSAGIRVIIQTHQNIGKECFILKNVPANVMELFKMTGFQKVLNFQ
ncbi:MAG: STAS domain-containing protein [Clostridia bacterium]|nr:STAS domain-containing protein [Clostridia bacterium]